MKSRELVGVVRAVLQQSAPVRECQRSPYSLDKAGLASYGALSEVKVTRPPRRPSSTSTLLSTSAGGLSDVLLVIERS